MHRCAFTTIVIVLIQCLGGAYGGFEGVQLYGINYNSRKGQDWQPVTEKCKDYNGILNDLTTLKTITNRIRIYSLVDCPVGTILDAAQVVGLQVALGIWTSKDSSQVKKEMNVLESLITSNKITGNIIGLHVGSEAIYRKDVSAALAIAYLNQVRALLKRYSITNIPLTIADVVDSYLNHPELVDAVDIVSVNQFSFWEPRQATIDTAMTRTLTRLRSVRGMAMKQNKRFLISETGWSSEGVHPNASIASPANQVQFFKDFYHQAIAHDFNFYYFTSFDTHWRVTKPEDAVEAGFGLFRDDRSMKPWFQTMKIGSRDQQVVRSAVDRTLLLSEQNGELVLIRDTGDLFVLEQGTWLFDTETSQLRSKGTDACIDAYQPFNGGSIKVSTCIATQQTQQWTFDPATKQLKHREWCLSTAGTENARTVLTTCQSMGSISTNQQWLVETTRAGCSVVEQNTDYVGNDIGSMPSVTVDGCCALCRAQSNCRAYTWSGFNGGMCWLKSGKGTTTTMAGVHSGVVSTSPSPTPVPTSVTPTPPTPSCPVLERDTDFIGNDMGSGPSSTPEGCCAVCAGRSGCKAYSWTNYMGGMCWLKSGRGTVVSKIGVHSAAFSLTFSPLEEDSDYVGNDLSNAVADVASKCFDICTAKSQCRAFTWTNYNGGTCWLKTAKGITKKVVGARSAYRS